jgi:hypothetical protein
MHFEVVGFLSCLWYCFTIPPPYKAEEEKRERKNERAKGDI